MSAVGGIRGTFEENGDELRRLHNLKSAVLDARAIDLGMPMGLQSYWGSSACYRHIAWQQSLLLWASYPGL